MWTWGGAGCRSLGLRAAARKVDLTDWWLYLVAQSGKLEVLRPGNGVFRVISGIQLARQGRGVMMCLCEGPGNLCGLETGLSWQVFTNGYVPRCFVIDGALEGFGV